jgi:23S rRNA pseudouridine1911/1915/1917 synthase
MEAGWASAVSDSLTILFEDNHCLAVAKPAPLLTQGPPGIPTLEAMVKDYLRQKYHKAGRVYLGIPHRLDRPVSGAVLFARNTKAARRLAEQFEQHQVRKVYRAVVDGDVMPTEGTWDDWLRKHADEARSERVGPDDPMARHAVLGYRRLAAGAGWTLLEIEPRTGRMHQIRVQAAVRGWPVRGDVLYGSQQSFGPPAELPRDRIIALHGRSLTFLHPIRYEPVTVIAPLPEYWPKEFTAENAESAEGSLGSPRSLR